ncbi:MAG TPA: GNAT family N-acetyltransferase [Vicinamibacteria bacterium]|nr:GNAT family N-acetyltransferase [Vicinamibacteria bacterium]
MSIDDPQSPIVVRRLCADDLAPMIAVDARVVGRRRDRYLELKLGEALSDTGIQMSLAAELDGVFAGFLLARVYHGEYGLVEPVAALDTLSVRPDLRGRGVGPALIGQLRTNLLGLGLTRLRTEVDWENRALLDFFHREGFAPAPRLCLELDLEASRDRGRDES